MLPFVGGLGDPGNYQVTRSLRFQAANTTNLSKVYAGAPTDGKKGTFSAWIKRTKLGSQQTIYSAFDNVSPFKQQAVILADDTLYHQLGDAAVSSVNPTLVMRDVSAWFHMLIAWDTTIPVQNFYLNGILIGTAAPTLNIISQLGSNAASNDQRIGDLIGGSNYIDGWMTEINFIDGQMLTPTAFGGNNLAGIYQPKKYSGAYGNNGFYLNFSDNSNTTSGTLGKDRSGNGNDWTPNGFSVAGAATDSSVDGPSSWGASSNLLGGAVRGNYPVWQLTNHLTTAAISNGALTAGGAGNAVASVGIDVTTLGPTEKIYWEVTFGGANGSGGVRLSDGGGTFTAAFTTGQIAGFRLNTNGDVDYTLNGSTWTSIVSGSGLGIYFPYTTTANAGALFTLNAGQRPFNFPMIDATYHELVSALIPDYFNLDVRNGKNFFDVGTWNGNSTLFPFTRIIKKFSPGIIWGKSRNAVQDHYLVDSTRGSSIYSIPNKPDVQSFDPGTISAINSDGFTLGGSNTLNMTGNTYVGWMFNKTAPFMDIRLFNKTGATNETFSHALNQKPGLMIIKPASGAGDWIVWHQGLNNPVTDYVILNSGNALASLASMWNSTVPTAANFTLGTNWAAYTQAIAYLFGEVPGLCKIGNYVGTGASGLFVYCGFRPAFVMIKRTDAANDWVIFDSTRNPSNPGALLSFPDLTSAETPSGDMDMLSNGFRLLTAGAGRNAAAGTYIYMAVAEHPFKYARAR